MSFNIALTGLNATNSQLNTISNNIANAGTTGFKGSRTEFSSIYNGNTGGGVQVSSISQNFDQNGSITTTNRTLDLAINGQGFFVTQNDQGQTLYSRSGAFFTDSNNFLVDSTGAKLQGYGVDLNNNLQQGVVSDLTIRNTPLEAKATGNIDFGANFDSRVDVIDPEENEFDSEDIDTFHSSYTTQVYDSQGNEHTVSQYFIKTEDNKWQVKTLVNGEHIEASDTVLSFDSDGKLSTGNDDAANDSSTGFHIAVNLTNGAAPLDIDVDLSSVSQFGSDFAVSKNNPDGYASGELSGVSIDDSGQIWAQFSNGQTALQGQVVLADFASTAGLQATNGTAWVETFSSGAPILGVPSTGIFGGLSAGALETSNVDITGEMVSLMEAQRNYQANTKTITTVDQLTQALFNAV